MIRGIEIDWEYPIGHNSAWHYGRLIDIWRKPFAIITNVMQTLLCQAELCQMG